MAKSGTTAVASGLRDAGIGPVFQVHDLDRKFLLEEERQYHWSGRPWRNWDAQCLLDRPRTPDAPWRVVSLVREPIAQSVSAFFQPAARRGHLSPDTSVSVVLERFEERLDRLPLRWFETHLQPTIGIDVYASDFDPARGHQIIKTPTVELLLLRCEGLAVAPDALNELLGVGHPIAVPRRNVGSEKDYAELYQAVLDGLRPSAAVIERAYSSRLVHHFYSPDEISRFREHWSARGSAEPVAPPIEGATQGQ